MNNKELDTLVKQLQHEALFEGLQRPEWAAKTLEGRAAAAITELREDYKKLLELLPAIRHTPESEPEPRVDTSYTGQIATLQADKEKLLKQIEAIRETFHGTPILEVERLQAENEKLRELVKDIDTNFSSGGQLRKRIDEFLNKGKKSGSDQ